MGKEAKDLAIVWGLWPVMGLIAAPHRQNEDLFDTVSLVLFGLYSLSTAVMTVRFLYRRVTSRTRGAQARPSAEQHEKAAS
ncbi:hypothetical protein [Streptomyces omiyaensis]|uniref:Uncharacterized protein n=1 Tax=Streptomyces omiyaensis TaxID=68247 RepID=A0ABW7C4A9_9ACTN|nr:hypothetical protein [Streptomyces omiyaensis]GGY81520.1 hypothetical protein GCM10010363_72890 [Streptomyces omiyaensis]